VARAKSNETLGVHSCCLLRQDTRERERREREREEREKEREEREKDRRSPAVS